jgi:hypothetical protein
VQKLDIQYFVGPRAFFGHDPTSQQFILQLLSCKAAINLKVIAEPVQPIAWLRVVSVFPVEAFVLYPCRAFLAAPSAVTASRSKTANDAGPGIRHCTPRHLPVFSRVGPAHQVLYTKVTAPA